MLGRRLECAAVCLIGNSPVRFRKFMSFDQFNLHPLLVRNLGTMGYTSPRPIQAQSIAPALKGRDVIGLAQTGTGKTAAFIVPVAHHLITSAPPKVRGKSIDPQSRLRALVICPTRELARQVAEEAALIAQGNVLRVACAYGKVSMRPQIEALSRGVDLLVATPGRVRELVDAGALTLAWIGHVVLDEADRMMDMGFLPQVRQILSAIPTPRQTLLFTATMPGEIETLAREFLNDPVRLEIGRHTTPVAHLTQRLIPVPDRQKVPLILHLLAQENRRGVLIFCNTKRRVGWVGTALTRQNIKAGMIHGNRSQMQREKALDRFSEGQIHVLVATDVAARGLHIPAVRTVVNYDLPFTPQEYVHRVGRAGHGGGFGEAFTLLDEKDRVRWRAVLDTTGVQVFAEHVHGFSEMPKAADRKPIRAKGASNDSKPRGKRLRVSKKSRPIQHGQKPGGGVRKLTPRSST
jgi:ATP-dependent RNA helicase RhlE